MRRLLCAVAVLLVVQQSLAGNARRHQARANINEQPPPQPPSDSTGNSLSLGANSLDSDSTGNSLSKGSNSAGDDGTKPAKRAYSLKMLTLLARALDKTGAKKDGKKPPKDSAGKSESLGSASVGDDPKPAKRIPPPPPTDSTGSSVSKGSNSAGDEVSGKKTAKRAYSLKMLKTLLARALDKTGAKDGKKPPKDSAGKSESHGSASVGDDPKPAKRIPPPPPTDSTGSSVSKGSNSAGDDVSGTKPAKRAYSLKMLKTLLARALDNTGTKKGGKKPPPPPKDSTGKSGSIGSTSVGDDVSGTKPAKRELLLRVLETLLAKRQGPPPPPPTGDFSGDFSGDSMPDFSGDSMPDFSGDSMPDFSGDSMPDFSGDSIPDFSGDSTFDDDDFFSDEHMQKMCRLPALKDGVVRVAEVKHFLLEMHKIGRKLADKMNKHAKDFKKAKKTKADDLATMPAKVSELINRIQGVMFDVTENAACIFYFYMPILDRIEEHGLEGFDERKTCTSLKRKVEKFERSSSKDFQKEFPDFMKRLDDDVKCVAGDIQKFAKNVQRKLRKLHKSSPRQISNILISKITGFAMLAHNTMDLMEAIGWMQENIALNQPAVRK